MENFLAFDPLEFKHTKINEAALSALKREIENILSSYVGWYDPFCELIQNSLDAVEARALYEKSNSQLVSYIPKISILVDIDDNSLTVSDNGIGLDKEKFEQFLAPNFSFKSPSDNTRGRKGVGATYVAYGFNFMRIATKTPGFSAIGKMINARNWLRNPQSSSNPKVEPDTSPNADTFFDNVERGVSITVRFDNSTHPKQLSWPQIKTPQAWLKILKIKTGLGAIKPNKNIEILITVKLNNKISNLTEIGTEYFWLHNDSTTNKNKSYKDIKSKCDELYEKKGSHAKLPNQFRNLDFIYDKLDADELKNLLKNNLNESQKNIIEEYNPTISFEFGYSATLWRKFNEDLKLRNGIKVLNSGIQLAANNMPQGEVIQIPLQRNIGRQNQVHFLIHFDNYTPDLGRKGFQQELVEFAKNISRQIIENHLSKICKDSLKRNTGAAPDLRRRLDIDLWKNDFITHEKERPLSLKSKYFFHPTEKISITSIPTREQDAIALFHQLIAGGVIRGINIMSTNERFIYDGLFKVSFDLNKDLYLYDKEKNPLGVTSNIVESLFGQTTSPLVLEYKYSLDGLIEDINNQDKHTKDIDLCVAWITGEQYLEKYNINSLLIPENIEQREYHGLTHCLHDYETGSKLCDLIILSELIDFLNNQDKTIKEQETKYEN